MGKWGTVYFGSADGFLYALNPNGSLLWKFETGGGSYGSAAISLDETVYFASSDGNLYALDSEGSLKWKTGVGKTDAASPAVIQLPVTFDI